MKNIDGKEPPEYQQRRESEAKAKRDWLWFKIVFVCIGVCIACSVILIICLVLLFLRSL